MKTSVSPPTFRSPKVPPPTTLHRPSRGGHRPQGRARRLLGGEIERPRIGGPVGLPHVSVEGFGEVADEARLPVVHHEPAAVGLVAPAHLGAERDHRAVGAVAAPAVVSGVAAILLGSPPVTGTTNRSAFVDVAGTSSSFREKQTSFPSGETPKSSGPPRLKGGVSPRRGSGLESAPLEGHREEVGALAVLPGVPMSHNSCRRPGRRRRAFPGLALPAGHTSEVARTVLSSIHSKAFTPFGSEVTFVGSPPARSSRYTWDAPSRFERNASCVPPG